VKTEEPHVNEVESSILAEVVSLFVLGLFSPKCFGLKWINFLEKDHAIYIWRKSVNVRLLESKFKLNYA
jgi:hypothetical protein